MCCDRKLCLWHTPSWSISSKFPDYHFTTDGWLTFAHSFQISRGHLRRVQLSVGSNQAEIDPLNPAILSRMHNIWSDEAFDVSDIYGSKDGMFQDLEFYAHLLSSYQQEFPATHDKKQALQLPPKRHVLVAVQEESDDECEEDDILDDLLSASFSVPVGALQMLSTLRQAKTGFVVSDNVVVPLSQEY